MQGSAARRYRLDFRALMALCEENFTRLTELMRLVPEGHDSLQLSIQASAGLSRPLHLTVLERCPYTTMLILEMPAPHGSLPSTRLEVRLYHDARTAEVTQMSGDRGALARYEYPNARMHQQDEKHQWNRFLADWLANVKRYGQASTRVWQPADPV